jgi:hypothetical protein
MFNLVHSTEIESAILSTIINCQTILKNGISISQTLEGDIFLFSSEITFKVFCRLRRKNISGTTAIKRKININIHSLPPGIENNKFMTVNFSQ